MLLFGLHANVGQTRLVETAIHVTAYWEPGWENGGRITLRTALRDVTTGKFKACAVVQFQESQRNDAAAIKIKPTGYDEVKKGREEHDDPPGNTGGGTPPGNTGGGTPPGNTGGGTPPGKTTQVGIKPITSSNLAVKIDTDRGPGPITLTEGEIVTLYVSVNQEAYLRFIYVREDGQRILFMDDNFHIDSSKVGTATEKEKK